MEVKSTQHYLEMSGDDHILEGNVETSCEKGFCIWEVRDDSLTLLQVYGDGTYWNEWATNKAKELGLKTIYFGTRLDPSIFYKHGFEVIGYIMQREV